MINRRRRGLGLVLAAFVACPCHLPVTLGVLATLLGGTWLGATVNAQPILAGAIITLVWALGTWRGLQLLRAPVACRVRPRECAPPAGADSQERSNRHGLG